MNKIAFVGAGKMAEAIISGIISSNLVSSKNIFASDISKKRLNYLKSKYRIKIVSDNLVGIKQSEIVILCVKPQEIAGVLKQIGKNIKSSQTLISIAAGINSKSIKDKVGKASVVRVMPNNPCLIKKGITAISTTGTKKTAQNIAKNIFSSVGDTVLVREDQMDAVTALSGSGPAFIYLLSEGLIEGGEKAGLKSKQSNRLALKTLIGSALTLLESGIEPEKLKEMVTSKGGTTQAGLKVLEKYKFKKALISSIMEASKRSKQLGKLFNP